MVIGRHAETCKTGCYTVHENTPIIVLVLHWWVTHDKELVQRTCSNKLLTESSSTYAVLKSFPLFLFCLIHLLVLLLHLLFSLIPPPPWTYVTDSLKLRNLTMVDRNVFFSVTLFDLTLYFYLFMNVILNDNDPIHPFNCLTTFWSLCFHSSLLSSVSPLLHSSVKQVPSTCRCKAYQSGVCLTAIYPQTGWVF